MGHIHGDFSCHSVDLHALHKVTSHIHTCQPGKHIERDKSSKKTAWFSS